MFFSTNRNPLQLLLVPVLLIVILFFTLHTNKGTYPPPVRQHEELSIPTDAEDWEFDGALKKIQQDAGGLEVVEKVEQGKEDEMEMERKGKKVQLDLTVMSRCPDARICEATIDKVLSDPTVMNKVNLTLNYIGSPSKRAEYGVQCMHGDVECLGNIHQLCVQSTIPPVYTTTSPTTNEDGIALHLNFPVMSFVSAQNYYDPRKIGQEEYAKHNLKAVGYDWEGSGVARCVADEGAGLLHDSVVRSRDVLKSSKSCTILLQGKKRCVHDGSWYDCDDGHEVVDFVNSIQEAWENLQD